MLASANPWAPAAALAGELLLRIGKNNNNNNSKLLKTITIINV